MESAKAAIQQFTSKHGQKDTTVHEHVQPAVTHEHVTPTKHESLTTAVDREVHQEHHHTSVQPIQDREVLPEKHVHNILPVEHKKEVHGDPTSIKERLAAEAAQFKDVSEVGQTRHTKSVQPVVGGEHVHHHVHEYVQPVIQRETVQPTVVHTTVPIHEVHHNEPKHHAASALPAVSLSEWKKSGGSLTGREERIDRFSGEPEAETPEQHSRHGGIHHHGIAGSKANDSTISGRGISSSTNSDTTNTTSTHNNHLGRDAAAAGAVGAGAAAATSATRRGDTSTTSTTKSTTMSDRMDPRVDTATSPVSAGTRSSAYSEGVNSATTGNTSMSSPRENKYADTHLGSKMDETTGSTTGTKLGNMSTASYQNDLNTSSITKTKPSLLQKLNPLKDADGDGRKGIMS